MLASVRRIGKISFLPGECAKFRNAVPGRTPSFEIDDAASFDANLESFFEVLEATHAGLAATLKRELPRLRRGEADRTAVLDALLAAAAESEAS